MRPPPRRSLAVACAADGRRRRRSAPSARMRCRARVAPDMLAVWQTAVQYHAWHALGLLLVGVLMLHAPGRSACCAWRPGCSSPASCCSRAASTAGADRRAAAGRRRSRRSAASRFIAGWVTLAWVAWRLGSLRPAVIARVRRWRSDSAVCRCSGVDSRIESAMLRQSAANGNGSLTPNSRGDGAVLRSRRSPWTSSGSGIIERLPSARRIGTTHGTSMTRATFAAAIVLAAALAAGGGYWFGRSVAAAPSGTSRRHAPRSGGACPASAAAMVVEASQGEAQSLPQTITAVGSLRSDESVTLRPEVAGRISAIVFQEGQRVAKGAPLVRLDPADQRRPRSQQARANLTLAQEQVRPRRRPRAAATSSPAQAKDEAENNLNVAEAARRARRGASSPRPRSARRSPASSACARCRSATT